VRLAFRAKHALGVLGRAQEANTNESLVDAARPGRDDMRRHSWIGGIDQRPQEIQWISH
jgi:hypothetical protein